MPVARINGCDLFYEDRGQGPVLVLVHGFPLDGRMWADQLEGLSGRFRVVVPDLRGFGRSPNSRPFTIISLADDLHALLSQIGARPCVLGGLSMGGYIALAYVKRYPADLAGLLLVDTKAEGDSTETKTGRKAMAELAKDKGSAAIANQMITRVVASDTPLQRPLVVQRAWEIMNAVPPVTIEHAQMAMCDREDQSAGLASIACPTLIIVGQDDKLTPPPMAHAMAGPIPRCRVVEIADAGHLAPMEQPHRVNEAIARFMEEVRDASA